MNFFKRKVEMKPKNIFPSREDNMLEIGGKIILLQMITTPLRILLH